VQELTGGSNDLVDLGVASNDPVRFPLVQTQLSKSSQESDSFSIPAGVDSELWFALLPLKMALRSFVDIHVATVKLSTPVQNLF
jgi:hypothetical protein